jgi:argininosuccinate lyase
MPHKRNPDVFELTRARAALVDSALVATLQIKSKLSLGYNRDVQTLKGPLFEGLDHTSAMAGMMAKAIPLLRVDRERARRALDAGTLSTDEVMRRVESGVPFRRAYRTVASEIAGGRQIEGPSIDAILSRRRSTGGLGNLGLRTLRLRVERARKTARQRRRSFSTALARLRG